MGNLFSLIQVPTSEELTEYRSDSVAFFTRVVTWLLVRYTLLKGFRPVEWVLRAYDAFSIVHAAVPLCNNWKMILLWIFRWIVLNSGFVRKLLAYLRSHGVVSWVSHQREQLKQMGEQVLSIPLDQEDEEEAVVRQLVIELSDEVLKQKAEYERQMQVYREARAEVSWGDLYARQYWFQVFCRRIFYERGQIIWGAHPAFVMGFKYRRPRRYQMRRK